MSNFSEGMALLEQANYEAKQEIESLKADVGRQYIIIQELKENYIRPSVTVMQNTIDSLNERLRVASEVNRILEGRLSRAINALKGEGRRAWDLVT